MAMKGCLVKLWLRMNCQEKNLREDIKLNKGGENFQNEGVVSSILMQKGSNNN